MTPEILTAIGGAFSITVSALIALNTRSHSAKRDVVDLLNQQMARMDERIKSLEFKIAEQDRTIDAQDSTIRTLRARITELETQNDLKDKRIQELETEIAQLRTEKK